MALSLENNCKVLKKSADSAAPIPQPKIQQQYSNTYRSDLQSLKQFGSATNESSASRSYRLLSFDLEAGANFNLFVCLFVCLYVYLYIYVFSFFLHIHNNCLISFVDDFVVFDD